MYKKVIWATDGSDEADAALQEALRLADLSGASIVAVHCDQRLQGRAAGYPALADEEDLVPKLRDQLDELRAAGTDIELVVRRSHEKPADVVASVAAETGGDIIVCGTRGVGALSGAVLGSFTTRLLHVAPCPVLAVRRDAEADPGHADRADRAMVAG
jgi:nucleotide-binding universal stress UspA family protein